MSATVQGAAPVRRSGPRQTDDHFPTKNPATLSPPESVPETKPVNRGEHRTANPLNRASRFHPPNDQAHLCRDGEGRAQQKAGNTSNNRADGEAALGAAHG